MKDRLQQKKIFRIGLAVILAIMSVWMSIRAANFNQQILGPLDKINLNISPSTISFPAADPDEQPVIQANSQVIILISVGKNKNWNLYIMAQGNLISAEGGIIPISNVSWVASQKPPLQDGVFIAGQNILMGSGRGRLDNGTLTFYLNNSWDYLAGTYTQIITFTASQI